MDPKSCPPTSTVLACDDESDCAGTRDDAGRPNVCWLSYTVAPSDSYFVPTTVASSQCLDYTQALVLLGHGLELCGDRQPCVDRRERRSDRSGVALHGGLPVDGAGGFAAQLQKERTVLAESPYAWSSAPTTEAPEAVGPMPSSRRCAHT